MEGALSTLTYTHMQISVSFLTDKGVLHYGDIAKPLYRRGFTKPLGGFPMGLYEACSIERLCYR